VGDTLELDRPTAAVDDHAPPVDPRTLGDPLGEPAVPLEVRRRHLARADEVVEHAPGHTSGQPTRRVPRLVGADVPLPLAAEAAT
jgi:hypothetical protein